MLNFKKFIEKHMSEAKFTELGLLPEFKALKTLSTRIPKVCLAPKDIKTQKDASGAIVLAGNHKKLLDTMLTKIKKKDRLVLAELKKPIVKLEDARDDTEVYIKQMTVHRAKMIAAAKAAADELKQAKSSGGGKVDKEAEKVFKKIQDAAKVCERSYKAAYKIMKAAFELSVSGQGDAASNEKKGFNYAYKNMVVIQKSLKDKAAEIHKLYRASNVTFNNSQKGRIEVYLQKDGLIPAMLKPVNDVVTEMKNGKLGVESAKDISDKFGKNIKI